MLKQVPKNKCKTLKEKLNKDCNVSCLLVGRLCIKLVVCVSGKSWKLKLSVCKLEGDLTLSNIMCMCCFRTLQIESC